MKKILIVDDEQSFLLSLVDMFSEQEKKYSILTAGNGKEAVAILDREPVDLVVTDLKMPEMDGFGLLAHMSKTAPDIPIIVMTAFGTPDMEDQVLDLGAFQYIEKPIEFDSLLKKIKEGIEAGSKGHVAGIAISSFLQLLELERKTCTLHVTSKEMTGTLYFRQGDMINAETEGLQGIDAAFVILCWDNTEIDIFNMCRKRQRVIEVPLGFLLIESARKKDELEHPPEEAEREAGEQEQGAEDQKISGAELDLGDLDFDTGEAAPAEESAETAIPAKDIEDLEVASDSLDDLDVDLASIELEELSTDEEEPTMEIMEAATGIGDAQTAAELMDLVSAMEGVHKVVGITRAGQPVTQTSGGGDQDLMDLIGQVTSTAENFSKKLDYHGLEHVILGQNTGDKLAVMAGPDIILGLEVAAGIAPADILNEIRPVLYRIGVE